MQQWMNRCVERLKNCFGVRLRFVGLQGSRARGEARPDSDIDVVVVLDELHLEDLETYRELLNGLPAPAQVCGFVSGWKELANWDAGELFHFYYDTLPFYGNLEPLRDRINARAVGESVRRDAGEIYHGCAHNMVHERDEEQLRALYKMAVFVLRARYFCQTGRYLGQRRQLRAALVGEDLAILEAACALHAGQSVEFTPMSRALFAWAQRLLLEGT